MAIYRVPRPFSISLFREAQFISLAFMTLGGRALLGLVLKNQDAARKLFAYWHEVLGPQDEQNLLRVALIFGQAKMPSGYFFRIGPNAEVIQAAALEAVKSGKYNEVDMAIDAMSPMTRHMPTANPRSPHMVSFLDAYRETGLFGITAFTLEGGGVAPIQGVTPLMKRQLVVRDTSEIKPGEEDAVVLEMSP